MNELKHELIELFNKYNLTILEFDELISFMQSIKCKAKLSFEFNGDNVLKSEQHSDIITNYVADYKPITEIVWENIN